MVPRLATVTRLGVSAALAAAALGCSTDYSERFPTAETDFVRPTSGLPPCSQRLTPVLVPKINPGLPPVQAVRRSFGAERWIGMDKNVRILPDTAGTAPIIRVSYPQGSYSFSHTDVQTPLGGAQFYAPVPGRNDPDHLCLHYRVRFPEGFDWVKGGKLPGLYGGRHAPSGGRQANGTNGWTVRLMWRRGGQGELYEYIVNKAQDFGDYGLSVGRGTFAFPRGEWTDIDLEVVLNAPDRRNGIARLWVDGRPVIEQHDIVYRTTDRIHADGLMFSTFFGGSDSTWASPTDQHIDFSDFALYAEK